MFEVGDIVICYKPAYNIKPYYSNKKYTIGYISISEDNNKDGFLYFVNDYDNYYDANILIGPYDPSRFVTLSEYRKMKIEKLKNKLK